MNFLGIVSASLKLLDCRISALDLTAAPLRAKTKPVIAFGVRCGLTEEE